MPGHTTDARALDGGRSPLCSVTAHICSRLCQESLRQPVTDCHRPSRTSHWSSHTGTSRFSPVLAPLQSAHIKHLSPVLCRRGRRAAGRRAALLAVGTWRRQIQPPGRDAFGSRRPPHYIESADTATRPVPPGSNRKAESA